MSQHAALTKSQYGNEAPVPPTKDSITRTASSQSLRTGSTAPSNSRLKALEVAARKREADEKATQKKIEQKREIERKNEGQCPSISPVNCLFPQLQLSTGLAQNLLAEMKNLKISKKKEKRDARLFPSHPSPQKEGQNQISSEEKQTSESPSAQQLSAKENPSNGLQTHAHTLSLSLSLVVEHVSAVYLLFATMHRGEKKPSK